MARFFQKTGRVVPADQQEALAVDPVEEAHRGVDQQGLEDLRWRDPQDRADEQGPERRDVVALGDHGRDVEAGQRGTGALWSLRHEHPGRDSPGY